MDVAKDQCPSSSDDEDDIAGGWIKVTDGGGYVYDVYIGRSEDLPELEDLLNPPK